MRSALIADAMASNGMREAGYAFINIDDGWQGTRDASGVLQPNPNCPDMKALAAYVHAKGLKLGIGFSQSELAAAAKPGQWNDPDMLEIGNGGMSADEYRTHFSLWALLAAPLIAGSDLRSMSDETKAVLLNRDVIQVNQDILGRAASRVATKGDTEVWVRALSKGGYAVGLFNRGAAPAGVTIPWAELNLRGPFQVRDLWAHADRGRVADAFTATVPAHGVVLLRLSQ